MDDFVEQKRKKLEKDILNIIEEKLKKGEMMTDRAQAIARMVLEKLHPPLTLEQIYKIVPTLDDNFSELSSVVIPIIKEHEEKIQIVINDYVLKLIKLGKIDEAEQILDKIDKVIKIINHV